MRRRVFIVHEPHPITMGYLLRGIVGFAGPRDRWEIIRHSELHPGFAAKYAANADGILLRWGEGLPPEFASVKVPIVSMLEENPQPGWGVVNLDDEAIGALAGKYLVSIGISRFGYWGPDEPWSQRRLAGFRRGLGRRAACLSPHDLFSKPRNVDWPLITRTSAVTRWLKLLRPPAGVLALNDPCAAHVVRTAREMGLSVPDDLAVVGIDNELIACESTPIPITSVDTNNTRVGYLAAQMLDQMMNGAPPPAAPLLVPPREVVRRRSTDMLAVEDADVRTALRYIREKGCQGINIDDVLQRVPICRRLLEKRFVEAIGHTPGQELRRVKLHRAAALLRDTTYKLDIVAAQCGYRSRSHLSVAFQKEFGISASDYREQ